MKNLHVATQFHKGGGGGSSAQPAQQTITSTPPPPTQQSIEVQMAQRDAAKQAAKRRGLNKTILAGETGGYQPPATGQTLLGNATPDQRKNTVLGGG